MIPLDEAFFRKCAQCLAFSLAANVLAQVLSRGVVRFGPAWRAAFWGFFLKGPTNLLWYSWLLSALGDGRDFVTVAKKVALDQLVYTPVGSHMLYLLTMAVLDGRGLTGAVRNWETRLWPLLLSGWKLWPLVHFANFFATPASMQIYVLWTASLAYSTIVELIMIAKRAAEEEAEEKNGRKKRA
jgi:hypothetical protein